MEGEKAEASSTTQGEEVVTKRSLCVQTWKKLRYERCCFGFSSIFNRVPNFIGSEKAAELLAETEEFKKANHVKVNIDRSQDAVKLHVLSSGKTLYLPPAKESSALCTKIINCPKDATEEEQKKIIKTASLVENRQEINPGDDVKLDMIVIGSVLVSRDGYRIGRGNGFVDLDIGILIHTGVITPETLIVTTVHEHQVVDNLPVHLFRKNDSPVDIIITPTEVIRVSKRLSRPTGITWEILSERRLKIVPVLQKIKENEEKAGKIITLKSEDTDVETNPRPQRPRRNRFPQYRNNDRRRSRNTERNTDENKEINTNNREDRQQQGAPRRRNRYFSGRRRRTTTNKSEGEHSSADNKENSSQQRGDGDNKRPIRKRGGNRDFCVKVSNISKGTRIRDLKAELRKRECNPSYISWKGAFGRCFLHFAKRKGVEKEAEIEKVLKSLNDLKLDVQEVPDENVVTKRSVFMQTWRKLRQEKCFIGYNIYNGIPNFIGNDKAADLLAETEEFKKANNIKVNNDRPQDAVKMHIISSGKTLYLPPAKESSALCTKVVDCPSDADEELKKNIIKSPDLKEHRQEINLEDNIKLDMVVIGSVVVTRDGHRVGRGNGFIDLDIGILTQIGAITPETLIVTTVHDNQIVDDLPLDLFKSHDTPVDIIATPTQIIRVPKSLPKPTGICWEMLSERRLKIVPVLQKIKENEEKAGKIIVLKSEDTDVETYSRNQRLRRRRINRRRSTHNNNNDDKEHTDDGQQRRRRRSTNSRNRRRRTTNNRSEGEQSSAENNENKENSNQQQRVGDGGDHKSE